MTFLFWTIVISAIKGTAFGVLAGLVAVVVANVKTTFSSRS